MGEISCLKNLDKVGSMQTGKFTEKWCAKTDQLKEKKYFEEKLMENVAKPTLENVKISKATD